MQKPSLDQLQSQNREARAELYRNLCRVVCIVCSGTILLISSFGVVASIAGHVDVVGAAFVNLQIPSPSFSPISAKPISILVAAALGLTFSGLELARPAVMRFSKTRLSLLMGLTFVTGALVAYEVMYNFMIWSAQLTLNSLLGSLNPDTIVNQFPNPNTPWNLVFSTKLTELGLAVALYVFYYLITVQRAKDKEEERLAAEERQLQVGPSRDFIER